MPSHEESALDGAVVGDAVDAGGAEEVSAAGLETGEEASDQVGGHEGHGQLVVVFVVDGPERVLVEFAVLPEPGEGDFAGLFVGVLALPVEVLVVRCSIYHRLVNSPVVEDECWLRQRLKRVLGLRCWLVLLLILLVVLGGLLRRGGCWLLLLGLLLWLRFLLWGHVWDGLLDEVELARNVLVDGLVGNRLVPSRDAWVRCTPLLVEEELEATRDDAGSEEVGESEALADEVGVDHEVVLEDLEVHLGRLHVVFHVLLVEGVAADQRAEPATEVWEELGVGEGHPAEDGGVVLLGLTKERCLLVLGGDFTCR